jgi:hypothetical protein
MTICLPGSTGNIIGACTAGDDGKPAMADQPLLPPGFRFHPTDEELVTYYLARKLMDPSFKVHAISEVDLNKCEPWDLPGTYDSSCPFHQAKSRKHESRVSIYRIQSSMLLTQF